MPTGISGPGRHRRRNLGRDIWTWGLASTGCSGESSRVLPPAEETISRHSGLALPAPGGGTLHEGSSLEPGDCGPCPVSLPGHAASDATSPAPEPAQLGGIGQQRPRNPLRRGARAPGRRENCGTRAVCISASLPRRLTSRAASAGVRLMPLRRGHTPSVPGALLDLLQAICL